MTSTEHGLPLEGVTVIEIATVLAGPYAGHLLRLLGAEVIKVEHPRGDPFRGWGAAEPGVTGDAFEWINAGKRSKIVDFGADSQASERVLELLKEADVLLVSGRPDALDRRHLSPARCHEANPNLVIASLTGYGTNGPLRELPAYDSVVQAVTGMLFSYGVQADTISRSLPAVADMVGGLILAQGALAGLVAAGRGRGGRLVETSLYEAISGVMGPTYLRSGRTDDRLLQSLILQLPCSDDREIVVHLSNNDTFWRNLAQAVDESLLHDQQFRTYADRVRNYQALRTRLMVIFASRTSMDWEQLLAAADVPAGRVLTPAEARRHAHSEATGMVTAATSGATRIAGPWRVDGVRPTLEVGAPELGDYT